jgi:integrase
MKATPERSSRKAPGLTAIAIKDAPPLDKPFKLYHGRGMFLLVNPDGSRWWRFRYKYQGREKTISLGVFPEVSVKEAEDHRDDYRQQLRKGIDPSAQRQAERNADGDTFKAVAEEWLGIQKDLSADTVEQVRTRLTTYLYPKIGNHKVGSIEPTDLLAALKSIEAKGRHDTAHRCKSVAGRVFRYAIATGRAKRDPSADLKGALASVSATHHAALTAPKDVGKLMRAIDGYAGFSSVMAALRLAPLVFVRPGELRGAEWSEIDLKAAEWRIPAHRMKMNADHIVPLSKQAVVILREQHAISGRGRYVFPSIRSSARPISENTINAALRGLGYTKEQMTGHGFRTTASTLLHEQGFASDVIERQLAHTEGNKTKAAYNRAAHLPERKKMMQAWADYLGKLRAAADKAARQ